MEEKLKQLKQSSLVYGGYALTPMELKNWSFKMDMLIIGDIRIACDIVEGDLPGAVTLRISPNDSDLLCEKIKNKESALLLKAFMSVAKPLYDLTPGFTRNGDMFYGVVS